MIMKQYLGVCVYDRHGMSQRTQEIDFGLDFGSIRLRSQGTIYKAGYEGDCPPWKSSRVDI